MTQRRTLKRGENIRLTSISRRKHQPMIIGRVLSVDDRAIRLELSSESDGGQHYVRSDGHYSYRPIFTPQEGERVIPWGRVAEIAILPKPKLLDIDALL